MPAIESADLVLVMTRDHRSDVVQESPRAVSRTFTLREFARLATLLESEPPEGAFEAGPLDAPVTHPLQELVRAAHRIRGGYLFVEPEEDDVVDPILGDEKMYAQMETELVPAVNDVARVIEVWLARKR